MVETSIKTDEHGMFMKRERVEEYFKLKGQVALIQKAIVENYRESSTNHRGFASVKCLAIAEILDINLDDYLPDEDALTFY